MPDVSESDLERKIGKYLARGTTLALGACSAGMTRTRKGPTGRRPKAALLEMLNALSTSVNVPPGCRSSIPPESATPHSRK